MATYDVLTTYFSNILRVPVPTAPVAELQTLAAKVDANTLSLSAAAAQIAYMGINTTAVATMSYQFFTGAIPSSAGIDYLVSPIGPNPNNLNSAYYQSFNTENRYINFAVNLGKLGEGQAKFQADYGGLSLAQALVKAYTEIFGAPPDPAKAAALLSDQVPNGLGGSYSRADYFAFYGRDGADGLGTKAAMVGWLLAQAAKEDTGVYAKANDALLLDIAPDKLAAYGTGLLESYGAAPATGPGATITVLNTQTVSLEAADPALRSTANNDTVTSTTGLDAGQWIATGAGKDTISVTGAPLGGFIDGGGGDDVITVSVLNPSVAIIGGVLTGAILGGAGNDVITVTQRLQNGSIIDGGAGEDTATVAIAEELISTTTPPVIRNVEHLVISDFDVQLGGWDMAGIKGLTDLYTTSNRGLKVSGLENGVEIGVRGANAGTFEFTYATGLASTAPSSIIYASSAHLHLDNVGQTLAPGVAAPVVRVNSVAGPLYVHVDSASNVSRIGGDSGVMPVVVLGSGSLVAGFDVDIHSLNASGSTGGVTITRFGPTTANSEYTATLSGVGDFIAVDLLGQAKATLTLGDGIDTVSLYQDGFNTPRFANMSVANGKIVAMATITDFAKGVDHLDLGPAITSITPDLIQYIVNPASLEEALQAVSSHIAANGTGVFEYNGDTYVYHQDATVGANTGDGLIRLVGVTGLSVVTGVGVVGDIHYG